MKTWIIKDNNNRKISIYGKSIKEGILKISVEDILEKIVDLRLEVTEWGLHYSHDNKQVIFTITYIYMNEIEEIVLYIDALSTDIFSEEY